MTSPTRAALAAACAGALVIPSMAGALDTTVRVEGVDATIVPATTVDLPRSGERTVADDLDADTVTVPEASATSQLDRATGALGVPLSFELFDFGGGPTSFVTRIGGESAPSDFSRFWRLKIDHVASSVGSDESLLDEGAEVLWSLSAFDEPELDVAGPTAPVEAGTSFTVTVTSFDNAGVATPAPGASVTYATSDAVTDGAGRATFVGDGSGPAPVTVRAPGAVRDSTRVCSHPADRPQVCDPAAAPSPVAPTRTPSSGAAAKPSRNERNRRLSSAAGAPDRRRGPQPRRPDRGGPPSHPALRAGQHSAHGGDRALDRRRRRRRRHLRRRARRGAVRRCPRAVERRRGDVGSDRDPPPARARPDRRGDDRRAADEGEPGARHGDPADRARRDDARPRARAATGRWPARRRRRRRHARPREARGRTGRGVRRRARAARGGPHGPAGAPGAAAVTPSAATTRVDMRVAVAGIRRSAALVDRVRAGLTSAQFAPGSLTAADLDPALRR